MLTDSDARVRCTDCANYRQGKCNSPKLAGLRPDKYRPGTAEVGPDLANMLQHCRAFTPQKK